MAFVRDSPLAKETATQEVRFTADPKAQFVLGRHLDLLSQAANYDLDDEGDRFASNEALVKLFFSLCGRVGADLFVEAGAWDASASRRAAGVLRDARVVAFEANPYLYRSYVEVNRAAGIEYLHRAVTDQPGPVTFNILRDEGGEAIVNGRSSLLKRQKMGDDRRGFEEYTADGVALDDFFVGHPFERAALWIDVEGASGKVLPGGRELLDRAAVVIIEVEELNWWGPDHWCRDRVDSYLYDRGLIPVARDFQYKHQYNIVFVRAELLSAPSDLWWALARYSSRAYRRPRTAPDEVLQQRNVGVSRMARDVARGLERRSRLARSLRKRIGRSPLLRRALGR